MNKLDSNDIRATLRTDYGDHLRFLCERPTVPAPVGDPKKSLLWQEYQAADDTEIEVALDDLGREFIDIDLEGLQ